MLAKILTTPVQRVPQYPTILKDFWLSSPNQNFVPYYL